MAIVLVNKLLFIHSPDLTHENIKSFKLRQEKGRKKEAAIF